LLAVAAAGAGDLGHWDAVFEAGPEGVEALDSAATDGRATRLESSGEM
jgi:hypothetical protein